MKNKILVFIFCMIFLSGNVIAADYKFQNKTGADLLVIHDSGNLTVTGNVSASTGFFSYLGTLVSRITSLFVIDIDASGDLFVTGNGTIGKNFTVDTNTLFVDSVLNRVGIGTTTPQNTLNVLGDINFTGLIYGNGSQLTDIAASAVEDIWINEIGDILTGSLNITAADVADNTSSNTPDIVFVGKYDSNVSGGGIIQSTRNITLRNIVDWNSGVGDYRLAFLSDSGTEFVTFEGDTSRVGIGTTTPQNLLNVLGDANITGTIYETGTALSSKYILQSNEANLNVNRSDWWDNLNTPNDITSLTGLTAINSTNWLNVSITESQISDLQSYILTSNEANLNVNRSDFWDGLNTPADINAADITDDNTYVTVAGDTMTGALIIDSNGVVLNVRNSTGTSVLFVNTTSKRIGINTITPSSEFEVSGNIELTNLLDNDASNFFDGTGSASNTLTGIDSTGALTFTAISITESQISDLQSYILTSNEANLNVNRSDWWDNLNTPNDITSLTGLTAINSTNWLNVSITESQISDLIHTTDTNETSRFNFLVNNDCSAGELVIGVQVNGTVLCASDADSGNANIFDQILNTTNNVTFNRLNLIGGWLNVSITESQISDLQSYILTSNEANLNVNSSNFWDGLNTPADINAADITDDGTYLLATGDTATGNYTFDTNTFFIDSSSNRIGIGTTAPGKKLTVSSGSDVYLRIEKPSFPDNFDFGIVSHQARISYTAGTANDSDIAIQTNGITRLFVQDDGNVGIGTTSPTSRLDIKSSGNNTNLIQGFASDSSRIFRLTEHSSGYGIVGVFDASAVEKIKLSSNGDSFFDGGNVGIGTTSPQEILEVFTGTTNESVLIGTTLDGFPSGASNPTHGIGISRTSDGAYSSLIFNEGTNGQELGIKARTDIRFYGNQDLNVIFKESGNVGIGTTSPANKLTVVGTLNTTNIQLASNCADGQVLKWSGGVGTCGTDTNTDSNLTEADVEGFIYDNDNTLTGAWTVAASGTNDINFDSNTFVIDVSADRVGIGTASPTYKIDVESSSDGILASFISNNGSRTQGFFISANTTFPYLVKLHSSGTSGGDMAFLTGNTERMRIDSSGNVGIGTASPTQILHVVSSSSNPDIRMEQTGTSNALITAIAPTGDAQFRTGDGSGFWAFGTDNDDSDKFKIARSSLIGTNDKLTITTGGNVGIGTTSPTGKLTILKEGTATAGPTTGEIVLSGTSPQLFLDDNDAGVDEKLWDLLASGTVLSFRLVNDANSAATSWMQVERSGTTVTDVSFPNGKVGIGTTTPAFKLVVDDLGFDTTSNRGVIRIGSTGYLNIQNTTQDIVEGNPGGNDIDFFWRNSANADMFRLEASTGNVGIGITSPDHKLHVSGNTTTDVVAQIEQVGTGDPVMRFLLTGVAGWHIGIDNSDSDKLKFSEQVDFSSGNHLTIARTTGNVGIGTTSPAEKLHVEGDMLIDLYGAGNNSGLFFREGFTDSNKYNLGILVFDDGDASPDALEIAAFDGIYFNTGSNSRNTRMVITQTGNVGIGTIGPSSKLEVSGDIELTNLLDNDASNFFDGGCSADQHVTSISSTGAITCGADSGHTSSMSFILGASSGINQTITQGNTAFLVAGTGITTTGAATDKVTIAATLGTAIEKGEIANSGTLSFDWVDSEIADTLTITGGSVAGDIIVDGSIDQSEIQDDILDFVDFADDLDLDATTNIDFGSGSNSFILDLETGTGDFIIQDAGTMFAQFYDTGDIQLGNNNELYVDTSTGRVGIGTTSPDRTLEVDGSIRIGGSNRFFGTASGQRLDIDAEALYLNENVVSNILMVLGGGNVGIGTTSPQSVLDLGSGTSGRSLVWGGSSGTTWYNSIGSAFSSADLILAQGLKLNTSADQLLNAFTGTYGVSGVRFDRSAGDIHLFAAGSSSRTADTSFDDSSATKLTVKSSGNVGIGTTSPGEKLDVITPNADDAFNVGIRTSRATVGTTPLRLGNYFKAANLRQGGTIITGETLNLVYNQAGTSFDFNIFNNVADTALDTATPVFTINENGNVGIGDSTPSFKLDVAGTGRFTGDLTVGGNDILSSAAIAISLSNDDASVVGCLNVGSATECTAQGNLQLSADIIMTEDDFIGISSTTERIAFNGGSGLLEIFNANLDLNNNNIVGVNKLTVTTIDPVYTIDNVSYATYVASLIGGVKEEITGTIVLNGDYTINFRNLEIGSNLWLFYQVTDFGSEMENLQIFLTPSFNGNVWYEKSPSENTLTMSSNKKGEVSYKLTANRFDWKKWEGNHYVGDGTGKGFILEGK